MDELQRAHEMELEAEYAAKIDKRFRPEVLDFLDRIERHTDHLSNATGELGEIRTAVMNLDHCIRFELPRILATDAQTKQPKVLLYVIAILLAIIAFK